MLFQNDRNDTNSFKMFIMLILWYQCTHKTTPNNFSLFNFYIFQLLWTCSKKLEDIFKYLNQNLVLSNIPVTYLYILLTMIRPTYTYTCKLSVGFSMKYINPTLNFLCGCTCNVQLSAALSLYCYVFWIVQKIPSLSIVRGYYSNHHPIISYKTGTRP